MNELIRAEIERHFAKLNRIFLLGFWANIPVFMGVAWFTGTSPLQALWIGALIMIGPTLLYLSARGSLLTALSIGISSQCLVALLIHLGRGQIEMHFYVFVMLSFLSVFADSRIVLASAATIALHHVVFFFFLPASIFDYQASIWNVVEHAVFVIVATIPACLIARTFYNYIIGGNLALRSLQETVAHLGDTSHMLAQNAAELAKDASSQATAIQETSASMDQVSTVARQSSECLAIAQQRMDSSKETVQTCEAGMKKMSDILDGMKLSGEEMSRAMAGIKDASKAISRIIGTIDEIAFQTNILALNAAVEAARAGDAGLGFSVVADEVRSLAKRSADAARETSSLVETAIIRSEDGVAINGKVMHKLGDVLQSSNDLQHDLNQVLTGFRGMDTLIAQLNKAGLDQTRDIKSINHAGKEIARLTDSVSSKAHEQAEEAAKISRENNTLDKSIQHLSVMIGNKQHAESATDKDTDRNGKSLMPPVALLAKSRSPERNGLHLTGKK